MIKGDTVWDINFTLPLTGGIGFPFEEFNQDAWDGYIANRNRLLNFINVHNLRNSIILSGDFHIAIVSELRLPSGQYRVSDGEGAFIVEFTTTAVSSPSTFPKTASEEQCFEISKELLKENDLIWNEGFMRGYFQLVLSEDEVHADYYGVDEQSAELGETHLAHFDIKRDVGRLDRDSIVVNKSVLHHDLK